MDKKKTSRKQKTCSNDTSDNSLLDEAKLKAAVESGELQKWDDKMYRNLIRNPDNLAKAFFACLEEGEVEEATSLLNDYVQSKYHLVKEEGIARSTLYGAFGKNGNPTLKTIARVLSSNKKAFCRSIAKK